MPPPDAPAGTRPIARFDRPGEILPGYAARPDGVVLYWDGARNRPKWIPLRPKVGPGGFRKVRLVIDGDAREIGVALLVLRAWVGPRPLGHEPLHYPDPDPANNRLENLRWAPAGTSKVGRLLSGSPPPPPRGEGHPWAVLCEADIPEIRRRYRDGWPCEDIAADLGCAAETVRLVLIGATWRHVPDPLGPIAMRRGPSPEFAPTARLDRPAVRSIRADLAAGRTYADLAAEHGVSECAIRDIDKRRTWKEEP